MDQLPLLGSGLKAATPTLSFFLDIDPTASVSALPPETAQAPPFTATEPSSKSSYYRGSARIKAKIMSHPLYPALLRAFMDCRKVGAPPEVVGRLSSLADDIDSNSVETQDQPADPALDQFMETYRDVLVTYSQELTTQIQEANEFFRTMEAHIDSFALANGNGCERGGSPEDEQEIGHVAGLPITGPSGEYSGYVRSLWMEFSGKKNNRRLPRDARQKLLRWWQLHNKWPYPSELEKNVLAESTGLDLKQINNWFINQRKRHWRPTPLTMCIDNRLQHINGPSSSSPPDLGVEVQCFTGRSGYADGGSLKP